MSLQRGYARDASAESALRGAPSFPLRHRLLRLAFQATWLLLARWTPPLFRPWRILLLRVFGAMLHPTANVYASVAIWYPPNLVMAAHATLGPGVICYCMNTISLGTNAIVSQRAHLCGGTHDVDDGNFQLLTGAIFIEDDAWIASEAFVGPGVTIGRRAVLGARGVTMKTLEPDFIYIGNPAQKLRQRRRANHP